MTMPVFTIKAKDALALQAVIAYRDLCDGHGLQEQAAQVQLALLEMSAWRAEHEGLVQMPDHKHVPAAPTSPSEPVPSTPRVPGSTERPEGILAELIRIAASPDAPPDRLLHAVDQAAPGRFGFGVHDSELVEDLCRAVVGGLVEHLGDLGAEVEETNDAD